MTTLEPRIYVACLAAYNSGYLHGDWIDANQDASSIYEDVRKILASSPIPSAEEWAIHDYEGFGSIQIEEYTGLEEIAELAAFISEHDELGAEVIGYIGSLEDARQLMDECYHGEYDSEADFASSLTEETMTIPENLVYYIDYEKMARDWFINDFFSIEINHKVHVFSRL